MKGPGPRIGSRAAVLAAAVALLGCLGLVALLQMLATSPFIDARWRAAGAAVELVSSPLPALHSLVGSRLARITGSDGSAIAVDGGLLQRAPRWIVDDTKRERQSALQRQLAAMLAQGPVTLQQLALLKGFDLDSGAAKISRSPASAHSRASSKR